MDVWVLGEFGTQAGFAGRAGVVNVLPRDALGEGGLVGREGVVHLDGCLGVAAGVVCDDGMMDADFFRVFRVVTSLLVKGLLGFRTSASFSILAWWTSAHMHIVWAFLVTRS